MKTSPCSTGNILSTTAEPVNVIPPDLLSNTTRISSSIKLREDRSSFSTTPNAINQGPPSDTKDLCQTDPRPISALSPNRQASDSSTQIVPLSSLNSSLSDPVCRICHGTANREQLMSLCYCSGSIGLLHVTCLQRWLGTSNKTECELCHFQFSLERKPKPLYMYLRDPGTRGEKNRLIFDLSCFCILTPLSAGVTFMCVYGTTLFHSDTWEFIGLAILATCLVLLYCVWLTICLQQNIVKWREWQQFNQEVKVKCVPPENEPYDVYSSPRSIRTVGSKPQMGVKIHSIEIKVITQGTVDKNAVSSKKSDSLNQTLNTVRSTRSCERRAVIPTITSFSPESFESGIGRRVLPTVTSTSPDGSEIGAFFTRGRKYRQTSSSSRENSEVRFHIRRPAKHQPSHKHVTDQSVKTTSANVINSGTLTSSPQQKNEVCPRQWRKSVNQQLSFSSSADDSTSVNTEYIQKNEMILPSPVNFTDRLSVSSNTDDHIVDPLSIRLNLENAQNNHKTNTNAGDETLVKTLLDKDYRTSTVFPCDTYI